MDVRVCVRSQTSPPPPPLQEPNLFSGTVYDNIAFGVPDEERAQVWACVHVSLTHSTQLTMAQVEKAARDANAHNFIIKLPQVRVSLVMCDVSRS
jgi:ABC-type multidrug transport system fused ATPase/permease subunit